MNLNQAQLQAIHAAMKRIEEFARYNQQMIEAALHDKVPMPEGEIPDLNYKDLRSNFSKMSSEFQIVINVLIYRR